ncbi:hypothetical protein PG993_013741 [Apiospora rasikravindrae]|uniref:DUF1446 domain-containing protein n=1 Tax=Apiospora rasikravindrae TaxID=990691 RepID=A0ABR1RR25_9PEZI
MAPPRRPIRIGNCSGAAVDPGDVMYEQAVSGPIDVITGDYLAEANLAQAAEAYAEGTHPGWVASAWDGLQKSLRVAAERRIKIVINGGALNPKGLAVQCAEEANRLGLADKLKIAWVEGDDLLPDIREILRPDARGRLPHLDAENPEVKLPDDTANFLDDPRKKIVAANAYLGGRAIRAGLDAGADIVICGRVADASPVMGAAAWWHRWADDDFDRLAGALVAGHLIECSYYVTGGNFAGFDEYDIGRDLLDIGCPIAEIDASGECIITKHEKLRGVVTEETVKCQLLYELQGNVYLNSDVKADITHVAVRQVGANRVRVSGAKGHPPPPTTKLAVFYRGGYQGEHTVNAVGYATPQKYDMLEAQVRNQLKKWRCEGEIDVLEFQRVGVPQTNPRSQLKATTYLRNFVQAATADAVRKVFAAWAYNFMQHFPGMGGTLDWRLIMNPVPFLGFFPALVRQDRLRESVNFLGISDGAKPTAQRKIEINAPRITEPLEPRLNYDPVAPRSLATFGPTKLVPLGDVALARSGDKGANVNVGFTPRARLANNEETWQWLRSFLTRDRIKQMMGEDWQDGAYYTERVEFPEIRAVHFVVYGALGRGVSSSARLDCLGKGFAEFLRAVHVSVPRKFLKTKSLSSRL